MMSWADSVKGVELRCMVFEMYTLCQSTPTTVIDRVVLHLSRGHLSFRVNPFFCLSISWRRHFVNTQTRHPPNGLKLLWPIWSKYPDGSDRRSTQSGSTRIGSSIQAYGNSTQLTCYKGSCTRDSAGYRLEHIGSEKLTRVTAWCNQFMSKAYSQTAHWAQNRSLYLLHGVTLMMKLAQGSKSDLVIVDIIEMMFGFSRVPELIPFVVWASRYW